MDDKQEVKKNCHYIIVMHDLKPEITYLYDNSYLFTNISTITYLCEDQEISQKGCMSCIVTLKAQCSIRADSYFLPETLAGRFEEDHSRKYPTALPLLMQFFTNDSLKDIKGYTQYGEAPNLQLPKFQFYETSLTKTLSKDEKMKVNLEKAVQSVKNDKVIVNGLSEAIVLGKVSSYVNFWITTPGIVTIITAMVGILSILANLYLLNKIRYLLIAVAILKTAVVKTHANVLNLKFQNLEGQTENEKMWHEIIQEWAKEINLQHMSIFLLVIIFIMIVCITCKLWHNKYDWSFTLAIEIVSNSEYYYVDLCTLNGAMEDYEVSASEFIKNITIQGWIRPTLNFKWEKLTCTNLVTHVKTTVDGRVKMTYAERFKIKEALQKEFVINPVFRKTGKIERVTIKKA